MAASSPGTTLSVGKRRHRRAKVMSEINVTPFVDVILVLLIIFMVSAPLMVNLIPVDLPEARAGTAATGNSLQLVVTAKKVGGACSSAVEIFLGETSIPLDQLEAKLSQVKAASSELSATVRFRGDRDVCYSDVMKVLGRVRNTGLGAQIVILPEGGG